MTCKNSATILVLLLVGMLSCTKDGGRIAEVNRPPEAQVLAPTGEQEPGINEFIPVDKQPTPLRIVEPKYPESAKAAGIEGRAFIKVLVGKDGQVKKAVAINTKGSDDFEKAAMEATRQWTFTPAMQKGRPVAVWVAIPFQFRLKDPIQASNALKNAPGGREVPISDEMRRRIIKDISELGPPPAGVPSRMRLDDEFMEKFGEAVEPPKPLKMKDPIYPPAAVAASLEGKVFIRVRVGKVVKAEVVRSPGVTPSPELEKAALDTVLQWTFMPAKLKGEPIGVWVTIPFVFKLK